MSDTTSTRPDLDAIRAYLAELEDLPAVEPILAGHYRDDVHALLAENERLRAGIEQHRKATPPAFAGKPERRLWVLIDD